MSIMKKSIPSETPAPAAAPANPLVNLGKMIEIATEKLRKAPWNYKDDDPFRAAKLAENMRKNGQVLNLVVREMPDSLYEVLDGNHRLDAVLLLGWKSCLCYNAGPLTEPQAKRLAIEVNETRFPTNIPRLSTIVQELSGIFGKEDLLSTFPLPENEVDALVSLGQFDWEKEDTAGRQGATMSDLVKIEVMMLPEQAEIVNSALSRIIIGLGLEGERKMARALELICADSLNTPMEAFQ